MLRLITNAVNDTAARPASSDDGLFRGNVVEPQQGARVTSLRAWADARGVQQKDHARHSGRREETNLLGARVVELRSAVQALNAQLAVRNAQGHDVSGLATQAARLQGQLRVLEGEAAPRQSVRTGSVRFHAHTRKGPETEPTPAA